MRKFKHKRLKALIEEKGYTIKTFAEEFGMTARNLRRKFKGEGEFSRPQIIRVCGILGIPAKDMVKYFFPIRYKDGTTNE